MQTEATRALESIFYERYHADVECHVFYGHKMMRCYARMGTIIRREKLSAALGMSLWRPGTRKSSVLYSSSGQQCKSLRPQVGLRKKGRKLEERMI
jgi:hypothetical protein